MLAQRADNRWVEPPRARGWIALRQAQLQRGVAALPWVQAGLEHAARALEAAPTDAEALALRGSLRYRHWQLRVAPDKAAQDTLLQRARRDLEGAVQADPSLARANVTLSHLYYDVDDVPGALLAARQAYEEDVYLEEADRTLDRLFWGSLDLEQFNEARRWCAEGTRRFPRDHRFAQCRLWLMATPAVPPDPDLGWSLVALLDTITPPARRGFLTLQGRLMVAGALARHQQVDSARRVLDRTRDQITSEIDPEQTLLAHEAYARILTQELDAAIELLKRYVAANPGHGFVEQAGTVWWWRELRSHPRWHEVAQPRR
jgi:tetratricopeptide (TPR) repeat protein